MIKVTGDDSMVIIQGDGCHCLMSTDQLAKFSGGKKPRDCNEIARALTNAVHFVVKIKPEPKKQ